MIKNIFDSKKASGVMLWGMLLLCFSSTAQDLQLFKLHEYEKKNKEVVGFVSFSEIYRLSGRPDSLTIPDIIDDVEYFKLEAVYRDRFLAGTNISETDKVFIYDYSNNKLATFTVKDLTVVARLNIYTWYKDCPCAPHDYMIGFEIKSDKIKNFRKEFFPYSLVYVGKTNPFAGEQLKQIIWKKAEPENFLSMISGNKDTAGLPHPAKGEIYTFEADGFSFFVQDIIRNNVPVSRYLVVIKTKTNEIVYRQTYAESEETSLTSLPFTQTEPGMNTQWTGKLFKKKPTVIFGFEYYSFGCPGIAFLNQHENYIRINCDNRH